MSTLADFVDALRESGVAAVAADASPPAEGDLPAALGRLDEAARAEFPGEAPPLRAEAGAWAARLLHAACLATVDRDLSADEAVRRLRAPCPGALPDAATVWSADILLPRLPELLGLARRMSASDPVTAQLQRLARAWPFSSVGAGSLARPLLLGPVPRDLALRRAYADRILQHDDAGRVGDDPAVDDALRAALGLHPELAPAVAARLLATAPAVATFAAP